jgi:universal stress protein A
MEMQRILVPVDFSESTGTTLQYAAAFAHQFDATLTLLHVVKPESLPCWRGVRPAGLIQERCEAVECQLGQLIETVCEEDISTEIIIAVGKPSRQIINEAKETRANLIIMGSHGAVGSWGLYRRNTTPKVVRHAPCPVLVVPVFECGIVVEISPVPPQRF